jgi:hypothetical protein
MFVAVALSTIAAIVAVFAFALWCDARAILREQTDGGAL